MFWTSSLDLGFIFTGPKNPILQFWDFWNNFMTKSNKYIVSLPMIIQFAEWNCVWALAILRKTSV